MQNTHTVVFKSPRHFQLFDVLGNKLGLGETLLKWCADATLIPYGHLKINLSPKTKDILRFCTDVTSV